LNLVLDYTVRNGKTDKWDASIMNTQNSSDMFAFLSLGMSYKIGNHDYKSEWKSPIEGLKTDVEELFVQIDGFTDDSDNDGVSDAFDKKPNTPLGVAVDGAGIALDVDMDNVPDYRDADPFSYRGAIVDKNGVELDDDKDGVPNSKDLETNTRVGVMVNQFGISVNNSTYMNSGGMIYFPSVYFNSGSAVVVTSNKNRLATIAIILKSNPNVKMKVIGHTDIVGDANFNKKLGLKRANAVINYLNVHYNIDSKRLIPETKGEEDPLSKQTQINNGIEDGSSIDSFLEINRRVDFDIID
jgi:OOP family OmpA-OmpF porin